MSDAYLEWRGFTLGSEDDDTSKLRASCTAGSQALEGLGDPEPVLDLVPRMAGGVHVGSVSASHRELRAPLLQCRSWSVANQFVASMVPSAGLEPLVIAGGPYGDPVVAFVAPMGAAPRWDVDSLGDREVVHVEGARWVAPDPTLYSEEVFPFTHEGGRKGGFVHVNAGTGVPPRGLGGFAWTVSMEVESGEPAWFVIEATDLTGDLESVQVVLKPVSGRFEEGDRVTVGPDRVPVLERDGTVLPVQVWDGSSGASPTAEWPRLPAGRQMELRVETSPGTSWTGSGEFRHTYNS